LVAGLGAALALAGCGGDSSGGGSQASSSGGAKQVVLGMSFCYLDNAGMVTYRDAETAEAKRLGWKVLEPTNANRDQAKQLTDIDALMNQGATALDIHQCTSDGVVPAIEKANAKNVPIFIPDQAASGGNVAITVQIDSVHDAATACTEFLSRVQQKYGGLTGTVIQVQGDPGSEAAIDRTKGFEDCMKQQAPNMKILTAETKWDAQSAASGVKTQLNSAKDLRGIFVQSDIAFSDAVTQSLKSAKRLYPTTDSRHIMMFGIDGGCPILNYIRQKTADFSVSSPLNQYGPIGLPFLKVALDGKLDTIKPGTKSTLENSEGMAINKIVTGLQVVAPPLLVTDKNVNDPTQWSNASGCKPS
jgi:ABC-type sugar transport system substrate-binding protein